MAITQDFKDAVASGKKLRIHIMMKDILIIDPTGYTYEEMEKYALDLIPDLYDKHDNQNLNYSESEWCVDYLNDELVNVIDNFSRERIELLKKMVKYLFNEKATRIEAERKASSDEHSSNSDGFKLTRTHIGIGTSVIGAVATITGICISKPAIIVGGAVVAAIGIGLIITDKGRE